MTPPPPQAAHSSSLSLPAASMRRLVMSCLGTSVWCSSFSVKKIGGAELTNVLFKCENQKVGPKRTQYEDFGGSSIKDRTHPPATPAKAKILNDMHCCLYWA